MNKILIKYFKEKTEYFIISILIIFSILITVVYNHNKFNQKKNTVNLINNIYLKKTLKTIYDDFNPKYLNIEHGILKGQSFENILNLYSNKKNEKKKILSILKKNTELNKIKAKSLIEILKDQSKNEIIYLSYKISNNKTLTIKKDINSNKFISETKLTKLDLDIQYKENVILSSLYKSANDEGIPISIIIEFARIYGFQIDFQRDIRKKDYFQILYETYVMKKKHNWQRRNTFC